MQVNIHDKIGHYQTEEKVIEVSDGSFKLYFSIDREGSVTVTGASDVRVIIQPEKNYQDTISIRTRKNGTDGDLSVNISSEKLDKDTCMVFTEKDNKIIIEARDGLGSWTKEFILLEQDI